MKMIENRIIEVIGKLTVVKEIATDNQLLQLGFDSLKKVELIIELENEFGLQFEDSELNPQNFNSVKDLLELVHRYIGE